MGKKKVPYTLGTWFAVPLRSGGYGVGIVTRANGKGDVLGYFFGPRREAPPKLEEVSHLKASQAVLVEMFGDLGLLNGAWSILGARPEWNREDWPLPAFLYIDDMSKKAWLRYYDDNLGIFARQQQCDPSQHADAPKDGVSGYGALEIGLDRTIEGRR